MISDVDLGYGSRVTSTSVGWGLRALEAVILSLRRNTGDLLAASALETVGCGMNVCPAGTRGGYRVARDKVTARDVGEEVVRNPRGLSLWQLTMFS